MNPRGNAAIKGPRSEGIVIPIALSRMFHLRIKYHSPGPPITGPLRDLRGNYKPSEVQSPSHTPHRSRHYGINWAPGEESSRALTTNAIPKRSRREINPHYLRARACSVTLWTSLPAGYLLEHDITQRDPIGSGMVHLRGIRGPQTHSDHRDIAKRSVPSLLGFPGPFKVVTGPARARRAEGPRAGAEGQTG